MQDIGALSDHLTQRLMKETNEKLIRASAFYNTVRSIFLIPIK